MVGMSGDDVACLTVGLGSRSMDLKTLSMLLLCTSPDAVCRLLVVSLNLGGREGVSSSMDTRLGVDADCKRIIGREYYFW